MFDSPGETAWELSECPFRFLESGSGAARIFHALRCVRDLEERHLPPVGTSRLDQTMWLLDFREQLEREMAEMKEVHGSES